MTFPLSHVQQLPDGRFQLADLQAESLHELQLLWAQPARFGSLELERRAYLPSHRLQGFDWVVEWVNWNEPDGATRFHKLQQASAVRVVTWRLFGSGRWHSTPVEAIAACLAKELASQQEVLVEALYGTSQARKRLTQFLQQNPQVTLPVDHFGV